MEQGNLTEQAISIIKNAIVMGQLKLGEAVSEIGICNRYKLSKTPVREALVILSHEGLVNKVSRKGCFVFDITLSEIEEIAELRYLLEEFAVKKSLKNNKEELIYGNRQLIDNYDKISSKIAALRFYVVKKALEDGQGLKSHKIILDAIINEDLKFLSENLHQHFIAWLNKYKLDF